MSGDRGDIFRRSWSNPPPPPLPPPSPPPPPPPQVEDPSYVDTHRVDGTSYEFATSSNVQSSRNFVAGGADDDIFAGLEEDGSGGGGGGGAVAAAPSANAAGRNGSHGRTPSRGTSSASDSRSSKDTDDDRYRILALSPTDMSGMTTGTGVTGFNSTSMDDIHENAVEGWDAFEEEQRRRTAAYASASSPASTTPSGTPNASIRRKKRSALNLSGKKKTVKVAPTAANVSERGRKGQGSIQTVDSIPYVEIRTLDVAERVAFERKPVVVPTVDNCQEPNLDKVSPSPQHVRVLERLYGRENGRRRVQQVCWSPAVSPHADPWGECFDDGDEDGDEMEEDEDRGKISTAASTATAPSVDSERNRRRRLLLAKKRRMLSRKRSNQFSRYSSIDPVDYVRATLPAHAPVLSNTRIRLPVRSDVGFPGATDEEIRAKHMEIMRETEMEEHSPRISVLISSSDLCGGSNSDHVDNLSSGARECMEECEGLPDIPLAGRELVEARIKCARASRGSTGRILGENQGMQKDKDSSVASEISQAAAAAVVPSVSHEMFRRLPGPNPTSEFAPPVGATYSSTHLWRPTPFTDQPPGMVHILSTPVAVNFSVGDIEPLVCSLAMYCLPSPPSEKRRPSRAWSYRGKISEDFVFPAGKWPQSLQKDVIDKLTSQFRGTDKPDVERDKCHQPTRKAIFSYDPLALPPSIGSSSLFLVLQVQKVAQADAASIYFDDDSTATEIPSAETERGLSHLALSRKGSMSGKFKKKLAARTKKPRDDEMTAVLGHSEIDIAAATSNAKLAFDAYGTEFFSPLCFGVLPLFPRKKNDGGAANEAWPNGSSQTMQLLSYPDVADTHEEFIERLARIAHSCRDSDGNAAAGDDDGDFLSLASASSSAQSKTVYNDLRPVSGHAVFFNSVVGVDFTQVLLQSPEIRLDEREKGENAALPRLLVDVTGDCAIMMSPEKSSLKVRKRSDLVRLPPSKSPSGYANLCEVREVLYLPPRPERLYDNDVPTYSNRLLNLLYLYPRELRLGDNETASAYTVRISLARRHSSKSGNAYTPTKSMYNPVPFGQPTLNSIDTRVVRGRIGSGGGGEGFDEASDGIHMHDEVKVRLPDVLDGSYFLEFSLHSLQMESGESGTAAPELLCETFIPLSSSSTKEPVSKERVVTIIPNGLHRIKLGSFQLLVESRLVSSIHSSDPGVSMLLRDFNKSSQEASAKVPSTICRVMNKASGQATVTHFQTLFYLHMYNLLNNGSPELPFKESRRFFGESERGLNKVKQLASPSKDMTFLINTIRSLLILMSKSKAKFCGKHSRHVRHWNTPLLRKFQKELLDMFDESLCSSRPIGVSYDHERQIESVESSYASMDDGALVEQTAIDSVLDALEDALIERTVNAAVITRYEQTMYAVKSKSASSSHRREMHRRAKSEGLLRTAYGASKVDRMKAEAELHDAEGRFTELFDDDETVVTTATFMSRKSHSERRFDTVTPVMRDALSSKEEASFRTRNSGDGKMAESMRQWGLVEEETDADGNVEVFATPTRNDESDNLNEAPFSFAGERAKSMAQRINTVAAVMMTPCMAPDLSSILAKKAAASPPQRQMQEHGDEKQSYIDLANREHLKGLSSAKKATNNILPIGIRSPGSDVDETEEIDDVSDRFKLLATMSRSDAPKVKLRGSQSLYGSRLELSVKDFSGGMLETLEETQPYLYECLLALWLHAWLEHSMFNHLLQQKDSQSSTVLRNAKMTQETAMMFVENMDILLPLCLKSFVLRCSAITTRQESIPTTILDSKHMQLLEPLVEIMARSLVSMGLTSSDGSQDVDWDVKLVETLSLSDAVLDFIVGLLSIIHPAQMSIVIFRYFKTLRACESEEDHDSSTQNGEVDDESTSTTNSRRRSDPKFLRCVCSRQLRLRAAERLSTLPRFVALNFPYKYGDVLAAPRTSKDMVSWVGQCSNYLMEEKGLASPCPYPDGHERLPQAHWLAELLANECFSICSESCEAVVTEAIAQIKASRHDKVRKKSALRNHGGKSSSLSRADLLRLQSNALHAVTIAYELLVRRNALDERFQAGEIRGRVAALFLAPVFSNTIKATPWLAKMESTHKIRSLWLLTFLHTIQEAPEALTREKLRSYCNSYKGYPRLHRFVRALRLCSSSCQGFISKDSTSSGEAEGRSGTWLVQETYNTICALLIVVVDECAGDLARVPREQNKLAVAVFDVLLHILSMPLSPVAHQRALGGVSQALTKFGALVSLEVIGDRLQHWARICLSLMNAPSLSVRSVAVDVVISLLSGCFGEGGNMDEIALVFFSVLPEVVAREMALYSVSGLLASLKDVERSVWPLRRALADIEEANPQDDDRIDPQLSPFLSMLCRGCQAVIDGVLIELRLQGDKCSIIGCKIKVPAPLSPRPEERKGIQSSSQDAEARPTSFAFDADEESIFEAASSFLPETGPLQRLRWLLTLKSLHEEKGQWIEAAETLMLCATTLADAMPHVRNVWRPSRFTLWHDSNRSLWLSTVGEDKGLPDRGNTQVMEFADAFLEPSGIAGRVSKKPNAAGMLERPSISMLCIILCQVAQEAFDNYLKEEGMESHAYQRFEQLLKLVMSVAESRSSTGIVSRRPTRGTVDMNMEENAALRKASAALNGHMTRLAERLLLLAERADADEAARASPSSLPSPKVSDGQGRQFYVCVELMGKKTARFCESTSLPTFLEWESPSICRVPRHVATRAAASSSSFILDENLNGSPSIEQALSGSAEQRMCLAFAEPLLVALTHQIPLESIVFSTVRPNEAGLSMEAIGENTFVVVSIGYGNVASLLAGKEEGGVEQTKRFLFKNRSGWRENASSPLETSPGSFLEYTVAREFPCALSRQRTLLASEFISKS